MTQYEDFLANALREDNEQKERMRSNEVASRNPCPADPELDRLFADFARRMNGRPATPFVKVTVTHGTKPHTTGRWPFKKTETVSTQHVTSHEVARGWVLPIEKKYKTSLENDGGWRYQAATFAEHILAVTTDGRPWFVIRDNGKLYGGGEAPTDAYGKPGPHVGPPIGSSIRRAIIDAFTINLSEVGITHRQDYLPNGHPVTVVTGGDIYEMLPQYIAKMMARMLNGSER